MKLLRTDKPCETIVLGVYSCGVCIFYVVIKICIDNIMLRCGLCPSNVPTRRVPDFPFASVFPCPSRISYDYVYTFHIILYIRIYPNSSKLALVYYIYVCVCCIKYVCISNQNQFYLSH